MYHVHDTFNSSRSGALRTVKGEIPSSAATMAVVDTERATPEDAQSCFGRFFELTQKEGLQAWNTVHAFLGVFIPLE